MTPTLLYAIITIRNGPPALTVMNSFRWLAGVYLLATNWLQKISKRINNSYNMWIKWTKCEFLMHIITVYCFNPPEWE